MGFLQRIKDFFTPEPNCNHKWHTLREYETSIYKFPTDPMPTETHLTIIQECAICADVRKHLIKM